MQGMRPVPRRPSALFASLLALLTVTARADEIIVGGDRPAVLRIPANLDPEVPAPLLVLLHGRFSNGAGIERYWQAVDVAESLGVLLVSPDGLRHPSLGTVWNAIAPYCPAGDVDFDDAGYLRELIEEIESALRVDVDRIFVAGHSLGGRMAFRMACEHADKVTAIVSQAGTTAPAPDACDPALPVHALHIHGTLDGSIFYDGGDFGPFPECTYLGALDTLNQWADHAGCDATRDTSSETFDLDASVPGPEARASSRSTACDARGSAELWTLMSSGHTPDLVRRGGTTELAARALEWLLVHPRRESPIAAFDVAPPRGPVPLEIHLDAAPSVAPGESSLVTYHWDFGDGTRANGATASHTFETPGVYTVSLIVTTDDGRTSLRGTRRVAADCPGAEIDPWTGATVGAPPLNGGAELTTDGTGDTLDVCATGPGIGSTRDGIHFVYQELPGDQQITLRIPRFEARRAVVGVQFRESLDDDAALAGVAFRVSPGLVASRGFRAYRRETSGASSVEIEGDDVPGDAWLRLQRRGDRFLGESSLDGVEWSVLDDAEWPGAPGSLLVGVFVAENGTSEVPVHIAVTELTVTAVVTEESLVRADCNVDGLVDLSDAVFTLSTLFQSEESPACADACDSNDDRTIDISDAILTLGVLFLGQGEIPAPRTCGEDPTDDELGCEDPPTACEGVP